MNFPRASSISKITNFIGSMQYTHTHTHTHTFTNAYAHTYIHTYTHTYIKHVLRSVSGHGSKLVTWVLSQQPLVTPAYPTKRESRHHRSCVATQVVLAQI